MLAHGGTQTESSDHVLGLFPGDEVATALSASGSIPAGWASLPYPNGLNLFRVVKEPHRVPRCDLHVLVLPEALSNPAPASSAAAAAAAGRGSGNVPRSELPKYSFLYTHLPEGDSPEAQLMPTDYKLLKFVTTAAEV